MDAQRAAGLVISPSDQKCANSILPSHGPSDFQLAKADLNISMTLSL